MTDDARVIDLDARRPIGCPHCDHMLLPAALADHRHHCPALAAKRAHPSGWRPGA